MTKYPLMIRKEMTRCASSCLSTRTWAGVDADIVCTADFSIIDHRLLIHTLPVSYRSLISLLAAMDSFHGPQQATRPIKLNVIRDAADAPQSDAPHLRPKWSLAARQMPP
ncbi:hypothetical protein EVG20_g10450 [Dentipellis fragilis]|uniref:Uncharacterized protein n=1 Tax=Dentipellis fragilis TaxID=205917 RepID=A0A4Y9XQT2_9AGAM|nr:hypothetical protein EVG20_g10450 [Dentipellis fragilis]